MKLNRRNTVRYHYQLGFPGWLKLPTGVMQLNWSSHAHSSRQRYSGRPELGTLTLPKSVNLDKAQIIDVKVYEFEGGGILESFLVRTRYNLTHDLCIVIDPRRKRVITAYLNSRRDKHETLDASKYKIPEVKDESKDINADAVGLEAGGNPGFGKDGDSVPPKL